MSVILEIETKNRVRRHIRVPLVAGFALLQHCGSMSRIFDIGKAKPQDMQKAGVALLGPNEEVLIEDAKGRRRVYRRRSAS